MQLLLLGWAATAGAQRPLPAPPDSLRAALRAAPSARARAEVLLRIVGAFDTPDPDSVKMLGYAAAAVRAGRAAADSVLVGRALDASSNYYLTINQFEVALPLLRQAEPLLHEAPALYRARNAYNLGWAYLNLHQTGRAKRYYRAASALFGEARDEGGRARVLGELGRLYQDRGRYDSAAAYMFQAAAGFEGLHEVEALANIFSNVASLYIEQRQFALSSRYCRQVYRLAASINDSSLMAVGLEGLGANAQSTDSPAVALRYLRRQQALVRHLHFYPNRPDLYINLAGAYRRLHRPDSARSYYLAAIALARSTHESDRVLGRMLTNLASFATSSNSPRWLIPTPPRPWPSAVGNQ